jgi:putative DNA primase/helicase
MIGEGANGKSTLLRIWEKMVGPENISSVTLTNLQNEFHRVTLQGKLLNIAAEVNPKTLEQSDYFKRIVTGDTIDAAHKGKPVFHFRPFTRLVFAMNRMPRVRDTSYGFYRRLLMVPFNRTFEGTDADRELSKKLMAELDGIFLWALRGLDRLIEHDSFIQPSTVSDMLSEYRRQNNPLVAFVEDSCKLNPEAATGKDLLYSEYKQYTNEYGYASASKETFFKELYSAYPELKTARIGPRDDRERVIEGIQVVKTI